MKRISLTLVIMISVLICVQIVSSVPPFQSGGEFVLGFEIRDTFPQSIQYNLTHDIHVHVFNLTDGSPVVDGISCYLHLYNSTGHHVYEGVDEVASHDFDYAWDIPAGNLSELGELVYIMQCNNSEVGGFFSSSTEITPTGELLGEGKGISFAGILLSMIALAFFFVYLSAKLLEGESTFPAGLFFLLVGILVSVQTLYMGAVYSRDYLSIGISNPQMTMFLALIYSLVGIAIISILFLAIKTIREIKVRKSMVDNGEYYNPQTKKY